LSVAIDQFYLSVARLTTHCYDQKGNIDSRIIKYGTGFFFTKNNNLFLITNRHVIIKEDEKYFPNALRMLLHTNPADLRQNANFDIHLYDGHRRLWRESSTPGADVIAIPLVGKNFINTQLFLIKSFSQVNLLPDDIQLQIGEDVLVMGYPLGEYYDSSNNLPIVRNGIISSAYPVPFRGNPYFLVDARLHPGTSGSPVTTKFKNTWLMGNSLNIFFGFSFYLLGINSSTFPLPPEQEPLGLNAVHFASIIDQMVG
jgi:hypothetical protein